MNYFASPIPYVSPKARRYQLEYFYKRWGVLVQKDLSVITNPAEDGDTVLITCTDSGETNGVHFELSIKGAQDMAHALLSAVHDLTKVKGAVK